MSQWLQWIILTSITGSPLLSALILVLIWWTTDRFTLRVLPDPVRAVRKQLRISKLQGELVGNPHDRRARHELGELMVERRRYGRAMELLRPNLEAGDDDVSTLYLMGVACLGAGHADQGEKLLDLAAGQDPKYRLGGIELERGRWRLKRGDAAGAQPALKKALELRPGSVEGRVLLARALEAAGDQAGGAAMRREAWREYVGSPGFHRRAERLWAWRAHPSRPLIYAVVAIAAVVLFARIIAPRISAATSAAAAPASIHAEE